MKIIYLHQYFRFPSESGGTRSYDLATGFMKNGYQVEIVTSTSDGKYNIGKRWVMIEENGLVVYYIYLPYANNLSYFQRSLVFLKFLWFSTFKILALKADVVLATSTPLTIGIPALIKKFVHKTPYIFEARDVWPEAVIAIGALKNKYLQKVLYLLEKLIYKYASAIVPLSLDMKQSIVSRYPKYTIKPIEVIENISEINRFQQEYDPQKKLIEEKIGFRPRFTILYAGTFGRVNGLHYVIELAEKIIGIDATIAFVLIGDGAEKKDIVDLALKKGLLNKNVFILDVVSKQELPQLYYECSMGSSFVISIKELWANSANKFFDTLAAERPILINHEGWQKSTINTTQIGYVLPEKLDEISVKEFVAYTQDVDNIKRHSENALKIAREKYSLEIAVEKYCRIFNQVDYV